MAERICPQCGVATDAPVCPQHHCPTIVRTVGTLDSLQSGVVIGGRYKIDRQIGKGGFGAVFLATHVATRQEVVLKVLKPDLSDDDTQVKRFFNEARASSLLSHPNTVRIFDFGQTDAGLLFIAMERLSGVELAQALKDAPNRRLDAARATRMAIAALKSLSEAHHAGLVHRDLKPDNIFLCKVHGEDEFVKVIDFGIAKPTDAGPDAGLTKTGFTVGTPKYMSPEQVMNRPLDGRSDLYALGVILYQCIAGEVPLAGASPMETLVAHMQTEPVPLHDKVSGLPREFTDLVMQALRKQPVERFVDADDMREALEAVLPELEALGPKPAVTGRTARTSARLAAALDEVTAPIKPGAKSNDSSAAAPKPPTGTMPSRAQTGGAAQPQVAKPLTAPQPAPAVDGTPVTDMRHLQAAAETALLEHPTLREPYQPSTMTLPTQSAPELEQVQVAAVQVEDTDRSPSPRSGKPLPWGAIGIGVGILALLVMVVTVVSAMHGGDEPRATPAATTAAIPEAAAAPPSLQPAAAPAVPAAAASQAAPVAAPLALPAAVAAAPEPIAATPTLAAPPIEPAAAVPKVRPKAKAEAPRARKAGDHIDGDKNL